MKYLLILLLLSVVVINSSHAQVSYVHIGATGSLYPDYPDGGYAIGGQLNVNFQTKPKILVGGGLNILDFKDSKAAYVPVYGTIGYNFVKAASTLSINCNGGYGIYKDKRIGAADDRVYEKGGLYVSPGLSYQKNTRLSPYVDIRYTLYQFKTVEDKNTYNSNVHAITASIGICILNKRSKK
jgi:hypothetical protein